MTARIHDRPGLRGCLGTRLLAAALTAGGLALASSAAASPARLQSASGEVELGRGAPPVWEAAAVGASLAPGDAVRTGHDGRAELRWRGATIRLYGDSLLRLPVRDAAERGVELDAGAGLFEVERREDEAFEVYTPEVVVSVKGTRFAVTLSGGPAEVAVYRGVVGVRARALALEREVLVREGFRAVGGAERPAELFLLEGPDPWSRFGPRAAPPKDASARNAPPPAKRALEDARREGRETIRRRALELALERDPGLADRVARARARYGKQLEADDRPAGLGKAAGDAGEPTRAGAGRLQDAARIRELERMLQPEFVAHWLNQRMPRDEAEDDGGGGPVAGADCCDVRVSGDLVLIENLDDGTVWQLSQQDLLGVLLGSQTLPPDLDALMTSADIDSQSQLAVMLLSLL